MIRKLATCVLGKFGFVPAPMPSLDTLPVVLRRLLADPRYTFRKLETLAAAIQASERITIGHLQGIGARPARNNQRLWTLENESDILKRLLSDPRYQWRKMDTLVAATGLSERDISCLLRGTINARPARNNPRLWGLVSRVDGDEFDDE